MLSYVSDQMAAVIIIIIIRVSIDIVKEKDDQEIDNDLISLIAYSDSLLLLLSIKMNFIII